MHTVVQGKFLAFNLVPCLQLCPASARIQAHAYAHGRRRTLLVHIVSVAKDLAELVLYSDSTSRLSCSLLVAPVQGGREFY